MKLIWQIICVTLLFYSCHKKCIPNKYVLYQGFIKVLPDKDSIIIGDTLLFTISLHDTLQFTNGNYDLNGTSEMTTDFHLNIPTGLNMQVGGIDSFKYLPLAGNIQTNSLAPSFSKTISFEKINNEYVFSTKLVALKRGVYILSTIDISNGKKNCDNIVIVLSNANQDNHLHYLKDIYYGGQPIAQIDSTHSYCFKVY